MYKLVDFFAFTETFSDIYVLLTLVISLALATVIALYGAKYITKESYIRHKNANKSDDSDECSDCHQNSDNDFQKEGIVRKIKTSFIKEVEDTWTNDEILEESQIQREQLAAIFELLKKQESELNTKEINEIELKEQLSLYH